MKNRIFCAIDTTDIEKAKKLISDLAPVVGGIKLGLEFFIRHGAAGVKAVMPEGLPLFLDLKFHDIPNTVAGAMRALNGINIFMCTIHASGGEAMISKAKEEASKLTSKPKVLGVTVLTSLEENDLDQMLNGHPDKEKSKIELTIKEYATNLARMAIIYGLDGAVCSPHEIESIRAKCGKDFTLVVPGIRPAGSASGDQKRVLTPKKAIDKGADYLVIGRPITESPDPKAAAEAILASITRT